MADPDKMPSAEPATTSAHEIVAKLTPMLRPDKRGEAERVIAMSLTKIHSGPLPAPDDLAHYEAISPGAAERIISMAEANMNHRHAMERTIVQSEYGLRSRGQWLALAALVAMLGVIAFTFWIGHPVEAAILGGGTLATVTGLFLARDKEAKVEEEAPPSKKPQRNKGRRNRG
ncbi:MAG: DUF2335 domain-containing protein [Porphyrobacter sp.]|nr:DUF2335 domain-containing protein [Porphyrobacter sp.]